MAQFAGADPRSDHRGRELAEKALRDYYGPTADARIEGPGVEVNGVHVYEADVKNRDGSAQATVTSTGEVITMGVPESIEVIAAGARETARLFKVPPRAVSREDLHAYYAVVKGPDARPCIVEFDAAGRIRDIKTSLEIREDAVAPRVGGPAAQQLADLTARRFAHMEVDGVFTATHDPGYFNVAFKNKHGRGWAIINPNNDVTEWRYPIARTELPDAVQRSIERELRGERILQVEMGAARLYRIAQLVGGEEIVYLVKPDGAVDWMSSRELHRHWQQH
jgi:hypothetical protein